MDSPVALALMTKAQAVFGAEDTFLSFPIMPLPFSKERLSFIANGLTSGESLEGAVEFSCLVNHIPSGMLWQPDPDRYLWDIYRDVLESVEPVELARSSRSPEEEDEYQDAFTFLHIVHDDATWEDTPQVKAYNQYRDRSFALQQAYNSRRSDAELATDPKVKEVWQTIDEPAMRAEMQALSNEWAANGYKVEVEAARNTYAHLGAKSPGQVWAQWHDQIMPSLDTLAAPGTGQQVFVTGFSPSDAIDASSWQRFSLRGDEVSALIAQVPDELKRRLASDSVPLDIDTLNFEYSSVSVTRSWLETDLFRARFWRFRGDVEPLCDGRVPPSGRCPAYVAAVVFARNVDVCLKVQSLANDAAVPRLQSEEGLSLGIFRLKETPVLAPVRQPISRNIRLARMEALVRHNVAAAPTGASSITLPQTAAPQVMRAASLLRRKDFSRLSRVTAVSSSAPSEPASTDAPLPRQSPSSAPAEERDDTIYVMAFICKRLPRCPDPDPSMQW